MRWTIGVSSSIREMMAFGPLAKNFLIRTQFHRPSPVCYTSASEVDSCATSDPSW